MMKRTISLCMALLLFCTMIPLHTFATQNGDADKLQVFIENCDSRYFVLSDISGFTEEDCLYARNAIFAKSGWIFSNQKLENYFRKYNWYNPTVAAGEFTDDMLNEFQIANRDLIVAYENNLEAMQQTHGSSASATVWTTNECGMSSKQAKEYSRAINNAINKLDSLNVNGDRKEVYATLVEKDERIILWLAGVAIRNEQPEWPTDIAFGQGCMTIIFEEMWEWDGSNAVEFDVLSEYGASANLWNEGLEVFTYYGGTDVDGEEWSALFPINAGKIGVNPEWCHAWGWIYNYKIDDLNVSGKSREEIASAFFSKMMMQGSWPNLPFDWTSIRITHEFDSHEFCAEATGGSGYERFFNDRADEYGGYWPESTSEALQCAAYIAKQDGTWIEAERAIEWLSNYDYVSVELMAYTAFPESTIGTNQEVKILFSMYADDVLVPIENYMIDYSKPGVLDIVDSIDSEGSRIITFKGLGPGTVDITFTEMDTNVAKKLTITVEDQCNYFRCSAFPIPDESIGGIYVADYSCKANENGTHDIFFNAYNTSYAYGVVAVYSEAGDLIRLEPLDPKSDGSGMEKVVNGFKWMWEDMKDLINGETAFYTKDKNAKHTPVNLKNVPENAEIIITSDGEASGFATLYTGVDVFVRTVFAASSIDLKTEGQVKTVKELMSALVDALIKSISHDEIEGGIKEGLIKEATKNISTSIAYASSVDSITEIYQTVSNLFRDLDIDAEGIMLNVLKGMGYGVADTLFTTAVPYYKIVNFVDLVLETAWPLVDYDFNVGRGKMEIHVCKHGLQNYVANNSVTITQQSEFNDATILDAYIVEADDEIVALTETIAEEMTNFEVYNITLRTHGVEVQPDGNIEVRLPVPAGVDGKNCVVYRIEDDGGKTLLPSTYQDGFVTFTTSHLSYYIVGEPVDTDITNELDDHFNSNILYIASAVLVLILVAVLFCRKKAKN